MYDLETQTREDRRFFPRAMTLSFFVGNISHHFPIFHKVHTNTVFDYIFYATRERFIRLIEKMVRSRLALDTHAKPACIDEALRISLSQYGPYRSR
ncbi:hypothetical protein F4774DRAFT_378527 [Daldinia eschscholtzii]|nr:hypothetical protein F4774DRAFT_378527 [Daldinia eschscholtzii]